MTAFWMLLEQALHSGGLLTSVVLTEAKDSESDAVRPATLHFFMVQKTVNLLLV